MEVREPGGTRTQPFFNLRSTTFVRAVILSVILIFIASFHILLQPKALLHTTDSVFYLAGAKSLAEGNGYRMALYEGEPRLGLYPPLQSAYLSLFWRANGDFPENIPLLNGAMLLLLLAFVSLLFFGLLKFGFSLWWAAIVPLCFAIQPDVFWTVFGCFSDLLFSVLVCCLALLWLGEKTIDTPVRWFFTGVVLGLMFITRTAAAPILLGAILVLCVRLVRFKRWQPLVFCAVPALTAVIFWLILPKETADYSAYFSFADFKSGEAGLLHYALSCGKRAAAYSSTHLVECLGIGLPNFLAAIAPNSAVWRTCSFGITGLLAAASVAVCIIGYGRHTTIRIRIVGGILAFYCIQLVFWPFDIGARGIMPLLPFIFFGFRSGLSFIPVTSRRIFLRPVSFALILGILPSAFLVSSHVSGWSSPRRTGEIINLSLWAKENIPEASHVATSADWFRSDFPMMHFVALSGHKLVPTKGENLESYVTRTEYVLYEGFPRNRKTIFYGQPGLEAGRNFLRA